MGASYGLIFLKIYGCVADSLLKVMSNIFLIKIRNQIRISKALRSSNGLHVHIRKFEDLETSLHIKLYPKVHNLNAKTPLQKSLNVQKCWSKL